MPSAVGIANIALAAFGSQPIQSFDDATPAGSAVKMIYDNTVDGIFGEYPWTFARQTLRLDKLAQSVLTDGNLPSGWTNAFALPETLIGPPLKILANARQPDGPLQAFEIQGSTVYTNQLALWAVGTVRVDENSWPAYFNNAIIAALAAELYPFITGNGPRIAELQRSAYGLPSDNRLGGLLGAARRRDASQNPSRVLSHNPLIDVRTSTTDIRASGPIYP